MHRSCDIGPPQGKRARRKKHRPHRWDASPKTSGRCGLRPGSASAGRSFSYRTGSSGMLDGCSMSRRISAQFRSIDEERKNHLFERPARKKCSVASETSGGHPRGSGRGPPRTWATLVSMQIGGLRQPPDGQSPLPLRGLQSRDLNNRPASSRADAPNRPMEGFSPHDRSGFSARRSNDDDGDDRGEISRDLPWEGCEDSHPGELAEFGGCQSGGLQVGAGEEGFAELGAAQKTSSSSRDRRLGGQTWRQRHRQRQLFILAGLQP
mmetsp:Transcript_52575/g.112133  ORF Transcript_52575/g.112133 Transcript_52575/m.112133 type:complete len:265 (-) Transcript_52575:195-989(-)